MDTADVIAKYLTAAGIRHIFGYPGDPNIEMMEAARREGMDYVLARREGTAGLMAVAYGQLTGRPGVALSTLGPGSSNLVNAVASAWLDRAPMIAMSGQIETRQASMTTHQVLNHNAMFAPVSKWATDIRPDTAARVMRKALRLAVAERPGPVHITTHAEILSEPASDDEIIIPPMAASAHALQVFSLEAAADPMELLEKSEAPIVVAGIGAVRGNAQDALAMFAEKLGCPVVAAPMAKGIVAETHPYFAGTLDMACNQFMWNFLKSADLILCVGFDAVELIKPWAATAPVIHIDMTANTDQIYAAETELVGSIPDILSALAEGYSGQPKWTEEDLTRHGDDLARHYYGGRIDGVLNPTDVVDIVREAMPETAVATTDVGSHKLLVGQGWTTHAPRTLLMSNGLSSMGYSLPAAIVAKLLMPETPVVCFTGDGGLAMVQGELALAASLGLGITVVVFCDDSLNRIEIKQQRKQYPSWGTRLEPTDIVKLAESMNCAGAEASTAAELEAALAADRDDGVPLVIGARIDPGQYSAQF